MNNYDDIINLDRPKSKYHKMDISKRAAIFSSFDPLDGFDDNIKKYNNIKDKRIELSDEMKEAINKKLTYLKNNKDIIVKIKYYDNIFEKYITVKDKIKKIDEYYKIILLNNNSKINIYDIVKIDYL